MRICQEALRIVTQRQDFGRNGVGVWPAFSSDCKRYFEERQSWRTTDCQHHMTLHWVQLFWEWFKGVLGFDFISHFIAFKK